MSRMLEGEFYSKIPGIILQGTIFIFLFDSCSFRLEGLKIKDMGADETEEEESEKQEDDKEKDHDSQQKGWGQISVGRFLFLSLKLWFLRNNKI